MGNGLRRAVFIGFCAFAFAALALSCAFLSLDTAMFRTAPVYAVLEGIRPTGEGIASSPYLATKAEHILWLSGNVSSGKVYVEVDGALSFSGSVHTQFPLDTGSAKLYLTKRNGAERAELNDIPHAAGGMFLPESLAEVTDLSFGFVRGVNAYIQNTSFGFLTESSFGSFRNCRFSLNGINLYTQFNNSNSASDTYYSFGIIGKLTSNGSVYHCDASISNLKMLFVYGGLNRSVTVSVGGLIGANESKSLSEISVAGSGNSIVTDYSVNSGLAKPVRWLIGGAVGHSFASSGGIMHPSVSGIASSVSFSLGGTAKGKTDFDYTIGGCFGELSSYENDVLTFNNCSFSGVLEVKGVSLIEGSDAGSSGKLNVKAGGVFGGLSASAIRMNNFFNTGSVTVAPPATGVTGNVYVGGIAAYVSSNAEAPQKLARAINTGYLTHAGSNGGAAGAELYLGGIFGFAENFGLDSARNRGTLSRTKETSAAGDAELAVGGLIGGLKCFTSNAPNEADDVRIVTNSENIGSFVDRGKGKLASGGLIGVLRDDKASGYRSGTTASSTHYVATEQSASHGTGFEGGIVGKLATGSQGFVPYLSVKNCLVTAASAPEKGLAANLNGGSIFTPAVNAWYSDASNGAAPAGFAISYSFDEFSALKYGTFLTDRMFFNGAKPNEATYAAPAAISVSRITQDKSLYGEALFALFTELESRPALKLFYSGSGTSSDPFVLINETHFSRISKIPRSFLPGEQRYLKLGTSFSVSLPDARKVYLSRVSFDGNYQTLSIASGTCGALFESAEDCDFRNFRFFTEDGTELPAFAIAKTAKRTAFRNLIVDFRQRSTDMTASPALCRNATSVEAEDVVVISATAGSAAPAALPAGTSSARVYIATTLDAVPEIMGAHYIFLRDPESFGGTATAKKTEVTFGLTASFYRVSEVMNIKIKFTHEFSGVGLNKIALYGEKAETEPLKDSRGNELCLNGTVTPRNVYPKLTRSVSIYNGDASAETFDCYLTQTFSLEAPLIDGRYFTGRYTAATGGTDLGFAGALTVSDFSFGSYGEALDFGSFDIRVCQLYKTIGLFPETREFDKTADDVWTDTENGRGYTGIVDVTEGGSAIRDVGTYRYQIAVRLSGEPSGEILGTATGSVSVTPLEVTVTPLSGENLTKVYDGTSDVEIRYDFNAGSVVIAEDFGGKLTIDGKDAGRYPVGIGTLTLGGNYTIALSYAEYLITKKRLSDFVWSFPDSAVYDKTVKSVTVSDPTNTVAGTSASIRFSAVRNGAESEIRNAGTYELTVTGAENPNYETYVSDASATVTYVVEKATANATVKQYSTVVYDTKFHFPAVVYGGTDVPFAEEEIKIEYKDSGGKIFPGAKNAGIYEGLTVSFTPFTGNYNEIETKPAQLTIEKRTVEVRFPGIDTLTYTGRAVNLTAEVFGMLANEKIVAKIRYSKGGAAVSAPTEPGEYTATVSTDALLLDGSVPVNYRLDQAVSIDFSIGKADMRDPQFTIGTLTYMDDTLSNLKAEARFRDVNNKYISSVRTEILTPDRKLEAGIMKVSIRWTAVGDVADYYNPYETIVEVTVNRKKVTIAAVNASGQYGDAPPRFEFIGGEEVLMVGDRFEGALALDRSDTLPAGDYQIGIGNLTAGKNYEIVYVPATYTVRPRRVSGTFGAIPYFVYDGKAKTVSIEIVNKLAGDEPDVKLAYYRVGETEPTIPIDAGSYRIVAETIGNPNYTFGDTLPQAQFSIARASVEAPVFEDQTVDYDGTPHSITIANLPEFVEAVYSKTAVRDAGVYPITANFTLSENYEPIAPVTATLTIRKATVAVFDLAAFENLVYAGKPILPRVFATDAKAEDRVEAVYETDRTVFEIGSYRGRITGVSDNNYELAAPIDITFTVGKRPVRLVLKKEIVKSFDGTTDIALSIEDFDADGLLEGVALSGKPTFRLAAPGEAGGPIAILIDGLELKGETSDRFQLITDGNFAEVRLTSVRDKTGNTLSSPSLNLGAGAVLKFEIGDPEEFEKAIEGVDGSFRVTGVYRVVLSDAEGNSVVIPADAIAVLSVENADRLSAVYVATNEGLKRAEFFTDGNIVTVKGASGTLVLIERSAVYDVLTLVGIVIGAIAAVAVVLWIVRSRAASNGRKKR